VPTGKGRGQVLDHMKVLDAHPTTTEKAPAIIIEDVTPAPDDSPAQTVTTSAGPAAAPTGSSSSSRCPSGAEVAAAADAIGRSAGTRTGEAVSNAGAVASVASAAASAPVATPPAAVKDASAAASVPINYQEEPEREPSMAEGYATMDTPGVQTSRESSSSSSVGAEFFFPATQLSARAPDLDSEKQLAVARLAILGFNRDLAMETYFACGQDEALAASCLLHEPDESSVVPGPESTSAASASSAIWNPGGAPSLNPEFEHLVNMPDFPALAQMLAERPDLLDHILHTIVSTHPDLAQAIHNDRAGFLRLVHWYQARTDLSYEEKAAVERIVGLGFEGGAALEAFLACGRDEEFAACCLLQDRPWPMQADGEPNNGQGQMRSELGNLQSQSAELQGQPWNCQSPGGGLQYQAESCQTEATCGGEGEDLYAPGAGSAVSHYAPLLAVSSFDALRDDPMFPELAQVVTQNPQSLGQMLEALLQTHPDIAQAISQDVNGFLRLAREVAGVPPASPVETMLAAVQGSSVGGAPPPNQLTAHGLSEDDVIAVEGLMSFGFDQEAATQAYISCNRNAEFAAGLLFQDAHEVD